jgi:hypothetical protein
MHGQPWISTQWVAQVLYAKAYGLFGWSGPVVLAASGFAVTFALLTRFLSRRLSESATLIFVAIAITLAAGHMLARPHALAMPFMMLWVGGLISAADRRRAPSFWLLPSMVLWANLHGGFVFGLVLVAPVALDAVLGAEPQQRTSLIRRWMIFGIAALSAGCCTPYGWNSLLASRKILSLGDVLPLITEWRPADFGSFGTFEICLLAGIGLALWRGIKLPPTRILLLLGLLHMALAQGRAAEILALLAPLVLAAPLAEQIGGAENPKFSSRFSPRFSLTQPMRGAWFAGIAMVLLAGTLVYASVHTFEPNVRQSPVEAVTELKKLHLARVFNDYDFGGYLIASGVAPFIDGRAELYGEKFFVDHNAASALTDPDELFRLLDEYKIEATLMRTQSAATRLLDHIDGWKKVYSDDIATIHVRNLGAVHSVEPAVRPAAR